MTLKMTAGLAFIGLGLMGLSSAQALTVQECSAKYQQAKTAGTLSGATWNQFRKTQCADATDAAANPLKPAAVAPTKPAAAPAAQAAAPAAPAATPAAAPAAAPAKPAAAPTAPPVASNAVFPKAIDPKYAKESEGKAREKTCLDQYNANKAAAVNGNGGLTWIQKGGGYYSECNKRLKGA